MKLIVNNRDYDQPKERLVESLGVLPYWVAQAKMIKAPDIVAYLDTCYGWGLHEFEGKVLDDGTYRSPYDEDMDMPYVAKMNTHKGKVYFYPYAMIAIPTDDGYFVTRMD